MKSLLASIFFCAILLNGSYSQGTYMKISPIPDSEKYKLIFISEIQTNVLLKIERAGGKIIFNEKVRGTEGFIKVLNLEGLETNTYKVSITSSSFELVEEIEFSSITDLLQSNISIEADKENKKYTVSCDTSFQGNWLIYLWNEQGEELISDKVKSGSFSSRTYDLKGAPARKVTVTVQFNERQVSERTFDHIN